MDNFIISLLIVFVPAMVIVGALAILEVGEAMKVTKMSWFDLMPAWPSYSRIASEGSAPFPPPAPVLEKPKPYTDHIDPLESSRSWLIHEEYGIAAGSIFTEHGIVYACSNFNTPETGLEIVRDGQVHLRTWPKAYSRSYLPRLAREFAKEVAA